MKAMRNIFVMKGYLENETLRPDDSSEEAGIIDGLLVVLRFLP